MTTMTTRRGPRWRAVVASALNRWLAARLTPAGAATNFVVFFLTTSVGVWLLPPPLLDWGLFAFMALTFGTEGVVMAIKVHRNHTWKTSLAVIIGVRFVLCGYFLFAASRQVFDQDRSWPDPMLYEVRAFVLAWLLLELTVIPYVTRRQATGAGSAATSSPATSIVDILAGDESRPEGRAR